MKRFAYSYCHVKVDWASFLHGSVVKNLPAMQEMGSIPGLERSPGEGNGNLHQYSCLGNPMGRGAWWATVHGVAKELDIDLRTKHNSKRYIVYSSSPIHHDIDGLEKEHKNKYL